MQQQLFQIMIMMGDMISLFLLLLGMSFLFRNPPEITIRGTVILLSSTGWWVLRYLG